MDSLFCLYRRLEEGASSSGAGPWRSEVGGIERRRWGPKLEAWRKPGLDSALLHGLLGCLFTYLTGPRDSRLKGWLKTQGTSHWIALRRRGPMSHTRPHCLTCLGREGDEMRASKGCSRLTLPTKPPAETSQPSAGRNVPSLTPLPRIAIDSPGADRASWLHWAVLCSCH